MPASAKSALRAEWLLIAALACLAVLIRVVGFHEDTGEVTIMSGWAHKLMAAGGWRGLGEEVGNYNAPYLYFVLLAAYLPGPLIVTMKLVWTAFDFVLAFFTYKLVGLATPSRRLPVIAALITLFAPSVVLNAAYIAQLDAMWASFLVGALYYLLRRQYWWAMALCGVALSFKPQAMFFYPLIGLLLLAGRVPWRTVLAIPAVYLALDVPALLIGRDPWELLTIYSPHRQARVVERLSYEAPSVYYFVAASPDRVHAIKLMGETTLIAVILGLYYVLIVRQVELTGPRIVTLGALFGILVPFLLPGMHERYFYLGDVLSVSLVFFWPRLWYVPVLVVSSSTLSYLPYFFHWKHGLVPMPILSLMMLSALLILGYHVLRDAVPSGDDAPRTLDAGPAQPDAPKPGIPSPRPPAERPAPLPTRPA